MSSPVKPLKALGQHFLNSREIAERIAGSLSFNGAYHQVLEIGPGTGVLTGLLFQHPGISYYGMDVDVRSVAYLEANYPELKGKIILDDFLKADLGFLGNAPFAIIGNFPYNISSQILFRVLDYYERIPEVVGMFQKEVAERIASPPGSRDYGILSVFLQAHYDIEYLFSVPPEVFIPPPKVQSGVIRLQLKEDHQLQCRPETFRRVVKTGFNQRRKTLRNSLKSIQNPDFAPLPYGDLRPEQLHFSQFVEMARIIDSWK